MRIAVVTGNPKPASRTHDLAMFVAATIDTLGGFDESFGCLTLRLSPLPATMSTLNRVVRQR